MMPIRYFLVYCSTSDELPGVWFKTYSMIEAQAVCDKLNSEREIGNVEIIYARMGAFWAFTDRLCCILTLRRPW